MLSRRSAPTETQPTDEAPGGSPDRWWWGLAAFGAVAVVLWAVAALSVAFLPWSEHLRLHYFPGQPWFEAWVQWDAGWYREIANHGYSYVPGHQSPVAYFPAYPMLMRAGGAVLGSTLVAGILVTLAAGAALAAMVWTWFRERLPRPAAVTALALLLLYPYAFYLYGAVYADALFIAATLGAFLLLEADHLWLAGMAGAVATAARPVGLVVVGGLVARALERRGVFPRGRPAGGVRTGSHSGWSPGAAVVPAGDDDEVVLGAAGGGRRPLVDLRRVQGRDAAVLVSAAGLVAYCLYLAARFGHPFLFAEVEKYWGQGAGPHTWLKIEFLHMVTHLGRPTAWLTYVAHPVVTVVALAFVPRVFRRFGWGYGLYSLAAVGVAALSTKDFFGCGRYVLAAFPCFAAAAEVLVEHPRLRTWVLSGSAAGLVVMTSLFARGTYLS
ncbi:MAG: hypothetical protein ABR511_07380 [Acidimicrobiales bacterium]